MAAILLRFGFMCRGCVIKGEIFHSGGMVVGPAIIKAHDFETNIANYPRILVVSDLRKEIESLERFDKWVRYAADGPMYVHILYEFEKFVEEVQRNGKDWAERHEAFKFICQTHETVDRCLSEARDNPMHFEKNRWFARYMDSEVIKKLDAKLFPAWPKAFGVE